MIDQIGGKKRIAFGFRRFAKAIEDHATLKLDGIRAALERDFIDYSSAENRLDDLAVVAFTPLER